MKHIIGFYSNVLRQSKAYPLQVIQGTFRVSGLRLRKAYMYPLQVIQGTFRVSGLRQKKAYPLQVFQGIRS